MFALKGRVFFRTNWWKDRVHLKYKMQSLNEEKCTFPKNKRHRLERRMILLWHHTQEVWDSEVAGRKCVCDAHGSGGPGLQSMARSMTLQVWAAPSLTFVSALSTKCAASFVELMQLGSLQLQLLAILHSSIFLLMRAVYQTWGKVMHFLSTALNVFPLKVLSSPRNHEIFY